MAPSKRSAAPPARAAKVAKREEPTSKQAPCVEQPERACPEPVAGVLDKLPIAASEAVVAMLQAGMPYILKTKPSDRHAYQTNTLKIWDALVHEVEAKLSNDVDRAEAHCAHLANEKITRDDKLQQARQVEAGLLTKKHEAEARSNEQDTATSEAALAAAAQKSLLEECEATLQAKIDERSSYVHSLKETWEPLKASSFAGKDWRLKNKTAEKLSTLLEKTAASAALAASLPVALKERLESRGPFTIRVIEAGEVAFNEHLQLLQEQEDGLRAAWSAKSEVLARATDFAAEKDRARLEAMQASIDAQNAWVDANSVVFGLNTKEVEQREAAAAAALSVAGEALNCFRAHVDAYALLANPPPPSAPDSKIEKVLDSTMTEKEKSMAERPLCAEVIAVAPVSVQLPGDPVLTKVLDEVPTSISMTGAACGA